MIPPFQFFMGIMILSFDENNYVLSGLTWDYNDNVVHLEISRKVMDIKEVNNFASFISGIVENLK